MVVAPHHLAAEAGLRVLRDGGNAIEAMIAVASTIAVVYPHMNALGGDNFWLVSEGGKPPVGIDACGAAAGLATSEFYAANGHAEAIPARGPLAALTVAGVVSGWQAALEMSTGWGGKLPLSRLLEDATFYAREGFPVTRTQAVNCAAKRDELEASPGFVATFMPDGAPPAIGAIFKNPRLGDTLQYLAKTGLDDFYRGDLARSIAAELEATGSPLRLADFERHRARAVFPLTVRAASASVYGMPPPTQGLASLMILGLYDRLPRAEAESFAHIHGLIEATKQAFMVRDAHVTDPDYMTVNAQDYLQPAMLDKFAARIDMDSAMPWPNVLDPGDTVWLGAIDSQGRAVSFIQSIYWEFGSGIVLPSTGILWQNRGTSFNLAPNSRNELKPFRRPFHTIQPAMAIFDDGRVMPYGTMGGDGQPQTQAALFTRYAFYGQDLQTAVTAPRWLLGRTWGAPAMNLRLEKRFPPDLLIQLKNANHVIQVLGDFDEALGHAGAIVRHNTGLMEGASDPRSDGSVAAY